MRKERIRLGRIMSDCGERMDAEERLSEGMGEKEKQEVAMLTARFTEDLVSAEIGDGRIGNRFRMWLFSSGLSNSNDWFFGTR